MNVSVDYLGHMSGSPSTKIRLYDLHNLTIMDEVVPNITIEANGLVSSLMVDFPVTDDVELWWPIGYGNQTFYNLDIQIQDGGTELWRLLKRQLYFGQLFLTNGKSPVMKFRKMSLQVTNGAFRSTARISIAREAISYLQILSGQE